MSISKKVINQVVEEMLANAQEMDDVTIVPNTFDVYLITEDYKEIQGLFNILREQIEKRLDNELGQRGGFSENRFSTIIVLLKKILGISIKSTKVNKHYKRVEDIWDISFKSCDGKINFNDTVSELRKNEVCIIAQYSSPALLSLDSQFKTVFTIYSDDDVKRTIFDNGNTVISDKSVESEESHSSVAPAQFFSAVLRYKTEGEAKIFTIDKELTSVGRKSDDSKVDLALECSEKISQKHIEIRFNEKSNKYFLKSLGVYGTMMNGKRVPDSLKTIDGYTQDLNNEIELPKTARIALAGGEVILDFESN